MALPADITYMLGMRDTADGTSVSIDPLQPFEIGKDIYKLNPNKHQLLSWVMTHAKHRPTPVKKFGHLERAPHPNWITYIGADESTQATTNLYFQEAEKRLTAESRVAVARTGEVIRNDGAVTTNTLAAVTRNVGTANTPLLRCGDKCAILPPMHMEGFTMGNGVSGNEYYVSFYTSIVDWPVQMTGTAAAEKTIDGSPFARHLGDAWDDCQTQMEAEIFFGGGYNLDSGTYSTHAATGLLDLIQTNAFALPGRLTRSDLIDMIGVWTRFNKSGGAIVTSGAVIDLVNSWAYNKVIYNQDLVKEGINVQQFQSTKGLFDLIQCDLFDQEEHLSGTILFLPNDGIDYRPLNGTENREIAYQPVNRDEVDAKEGRIFGEYGYEYFGEERFGIATGIEF